MLALSLSALAGFVGLGTEAASWYNTKRTMQGAADAAASAAALALAANEASSTFTTLARSIAASYSFVNGSNGTKVTVNYPPTSGSYTGSAAVEVIISQTQTPLLSGVFISTGPTIGARAVGLANTSRTGQGCVVALDPNNETSFTVSGSAALTFNSCSLYDNSPSTSALNINAGGSISALSAYLAGNVSGTGLTTTAGTFTGADPMLDPYLSASVPSYSGCGSTNYKLNGGRSETISVNASGYYVFCNGLQVLGGGVLTLGAGTFIIDRGQLDVQANATLTATSGTTIILTTSDPTKSCATSSISGSSTVSITAPTSGSLSGLALFQDRACTDTSASNSLSGGSTQSITGAIYFPHEPVTWSGGASTGGAVCTQLLAWSISFSGSSTFNSNCTSAGTKTVALTGGNVVE
jgi:hypothetical protein